MDAYEEKRFRRLDKQWNSVRCLLIIVSSIIWSCTRTRPPDAGERVIVALSSDAPVGIDGMLDDAVWSMTTGIVLKNSDTGDAVSDAASSTIAMVCTNGRRLVIAFVCNDRDIRSRFVNRDDHLWEDDAVEVFIDTDDDMRDYVEIELSPRNVVFDSFITDTLNIDVEATSAFDLPGIRTAVHVNGTVNAFEDVDKRWTAEIAIPMEELSPFPPGGASIDFTWRVNFYRVDRGENGVVNHAWSPTYGRFHRPSRFGRLVIRGGGNEE